MISYATALSLTVLIEVSVALLLGYRQGRFVLAVILVNLVSHPLLSVLAYANGYFGGVVDRPPLILVLEAGVVLLEGFLLTDTFELPARSLYGLSLAMNVASFLTGLALFGI